MGQQTVLKLEFMTKFTFFEPFILLDSGNVSIKNAKFLRMRKRLDAIYKNKYFQESGGGIKSLFPVFLKILQYEKTINNKISLKVKV